MRRLPTILISIVLIFLATQAQGQKSAGSRVIETFKYKDIQWQIPKIGEDVERLELENGMVLFLLPDHELPLIEVRALIRTGSIYEPTERMAIPRLTGSLMRLGGTKNLSPDSLNALLEYIAGSVETSIGVESGSASLSVLAKDIELGFEILADVLMNPAFAEEKLELEKSQIKESIRRRNDNPGSIIGREFNHLLYEDHPYGRILEWDYVKGITRKDLIEFHEKYYAPNNVMMAVAGDFEKDELLRIIGDSFDGWKKKQIDFEPVPEVAREFKPGVYLIEKDISQANIRIGQLGIRRHNPDRYAITLMNFILGGGSFTSRLTTVVRSNEGLAYSVGSRFDTGSRDYGTFYAYCQTKSSTAHKAAELILDEIKRIRENPIDEDELRMACDAYVNKFVFNFTSSSQIVNQLMWLEYNGYPEDYYEKYLGNMRAVTVDDILKVGRKYIDPDSLTIMVVGKPSDFDTVFEDLGKLEMIRLEPPELD